MNFYSFVRSFDAVTSTSTRFRWTPWKTSSTCLSSSNAPFARNRMGTRSDSRSSATKKSTIVRRDGFGPFRFADLSSAARETSQLQLGKHLHVDPLSFARFPKENCRSSSSGSALEYKVENLKSNTQYEYRIQCKCGLDGGRSEWSPTLVAATTPEPMNGETVFKAIAFPGKDQLEKLLNILWVHLREMREQRLFL